MGKTSKWFKNLLTGKKEKVKSHASNEQPANSDEPTISTVPTTPPKEKRRWSFRRASAAAGNDNKQEMEMAAATAAVATAAVAAAQAAAAAVRLTAVTTDKATATGEAAATTIQSVFRGYLARKALCALKGLVKLQALVRGHLVRKRATATLRCMQALVTVQARARAQRIRTVQEVDPAHHTNYDLQRGMEENIKIVEMDTQHLKANHLKSRNSFSYRGQEDQTDRRFSTHSAPNHRGYPNQQPYWETSPAPSSSAFTDKSFRTYSGRFEDYYSFNTAQSSPQCYYSSVASKSSYHNAAAESLSSLSYNDNINNKACPNYMANTASSKAKFRSQSAPKLRPDSQDRPPSRRRPSIEGRNVPPRAMKMMQRSSSHVASAAQNYQYPPGPVKLDKSTVSLKESECGSTSTILTNTNYCRSLVGFDVHRSRY